MPLAHVRPAFGALRARRRRSLPPGVCETGKCYPVRLPRLRVSSASVWSSLSHETVANSKRTTRNTEKLLIMNEKCKMLGNSVFCSAILRRRHTCRQSWCRGMPYARPFRYIRGPLVALLRPTRRPTESHIFLLILSFPFVTSIVYSSRLFCPHVLHTARESSRVERRQQQEKSTRLSSQRRTTTPNTERNLSRLLCTCSERSVDIEYR